MSRKTLARLVAMAILATLVGLLAWLDQGDLAKPIVTLLAGLGAVGGLLVPFDPDKRRSTDAEVEVESGRTGPPRGDGGAGFIAVDLARILAVVTLAVFALSAALSGCTTLTVPKGAVVLDPLDGPGVEVRVLDDAGDERAAILVERLTGPVMIPGSLLCSTLREVLVSFAGDATKADAWLAGNTACTEGSP